MQPRWALYVAALLTVAPAHAGYLFDEADLPEGFECRDPAEEYGKTCEEQKRFQAWNQVYGDRYAFWLESMLFRTDIYFAHRVAVLPKFNSRKVPYQFDPAPTETSNLIDAHYDIQLRSFGDWAFAINQVAQMRLVRHKADHEVDPKLAEKGKAILPTHIGEVAEILQIGAAFEEADLTQCKGATAQLLSFPAQSAKPLWDTKELTFTPDYAPKEQEDVITITLDGAGVHVRTRGVAAMGGESVPQVTYSEFNGGAVFDWALKMEEIARPCLKTSNAVPPWQKFVEAEERLMASAANN